MVHVMTDISTNTSDISKTNNLWTSNNSNNQIESISQFIHNINNNIPKKEVLSSIPSNKKKPKPKKSSPVYPKVCSPLPPICSTIRGSSLSTSTAPSSKKWKSMTKNQSKSNSVYKNPEKSPLPTTDPSNTSTSTP